MVGAVLTPGDTAVNKTQGTYIPIGIPCHSSYIMTS